jgi:transcriptional regulator of arginine metabolism
MHPEKHRRHQAIRDAIAREAISSQEVLRQRLERAGFQVTQATLSRDLKELGVVKRVTRTGIYRYAAPDLFAGLPILGFSSSGNILVLKTEIGSAPRVAYQIDALHMPEVLGTVAGEDTLLVVVAEGNRPEAVAEQIWSRIEDELR